MEQGLFALAYGEEHGGVEVSMHCWVQVIERIARESPAVALMILISAIGSDALVFSGSAEQQRAILPALAAGEAKICFALTEPNAGSDISAISTTALPDGDGYTINGGKIFLSLIHISEPTRQAEISYAVFCLKKKKKKQYIKTPT